MLRKIMHITFSCLLTVSAYSQLELNNKLVFTSSNPAERKITNAGSTGAETNGIGFSSYRNNEMTYAATTRQGDTLLAVFAVPFSSLTEGMRVLLVLPAGISPVKYLKIDTNTVVNINKNVSETADTSDQKTTKIWWLEFDGSAFQLLNTFEKTCPSGFVKVNDQYCIEINDSGVSLDFWEASAWCANKNAKLCSWGQWYYACQQAATLGLVNMNNNWEWLDAGQNHTDAASQAGNVNCTTEQSQSILSVGLTVRARCCFNR
ncbi:MAG: hypothetical protein ACOZCO_09775 [Bacteroidota bacterium]